MTEKPSKVGYIRLRFNDGTYKDFKKDDENFGIISAEQIKALGTYVGSKNVKTFSEMTEEEQKLFSDENDLADFREG
jgi:hypothetical protein